MPPLQAAQTLPRVELSAEEVARIGHGLKIPMEALPADAEEFAAVDRSGRLVSILRRRGPGLLCPLRNLPQQQ